MYTTSYEQPAQLSAIRALPGTGPEQRAVLHVQSVSAWAPACIGPYAQAAVGGGMLYMAGQIGLDPAFMQLVSGRRCSGGMCASHFGQDV